MAQLFSTWPVRVSILVLCLLPTKSLIAQNRESFEVAASAGIASYDLAGTGKGTILAFDVDLPITSFLIIEPGVRLFKYTAQSNTAISHLLPEVSLQLQLPANRVTPYVGAGAGFSTIVEGDRFTNLTLHAAIGMRIQVQPLWRVRGEARFRSIDPWVGSAVDFTVGISRGF